MRTAGPMSSEDDAMSPMAAVADFLDGLVRPVHILVAVSGGSDSVGLLCLLARAVSQLSARDVTLSAATIDHGLRGESAGEALGVAELCGRLGVAHTIRRWEGPKPASGISAMAREARYRLLLDIGAEHGADALLTGHTLDDQMETVVMRAARNCQAGNLGLAGMAPAVLLEGRTWLLRPLLAVRRAAIRAWLTVQEIGWVDDPSNQDRHYERVRMRQAFAAGGDDERSVAARESGRLAAAERRTALSHAAATWAQAHVRVMPLMLVRIAPAALQAAPDVLRHLVGTSAAIVGGQAHLPGAEKTDRVMGFLRRGQPGRLTASRVVFDLRRDGLYLTREGRGLAGLTVPAGETVTWDGRFRIVNGGSCPLAVAPMAADRHRVEALFPGVPVSIGLRALAASPFLSARPKDEGRGEAVIPVLAPFDRILSQFDLPLATTMGELFGCEAPKPPPIKLSARKS